jgi:LemA protein
MAWIVVALVLAVLGFWAIGAHNRLLGLRTRCRTAFGQIELQLKRRHEIIPDLVQTARAVMKHERETLDAVIRARDGAVAAIQRAAGDPGSLPAIDALVGAEQALNGALARLSALAEAYPDLKTDRNMQRLSEELGGTQARIAFARQAFNEAVVDFNAALAQFPTNLLAAALGFKRAGPLEAGSPELPDKPGAERGQAT